MKSQIISLLRSSAIRGQVLGDNRFHMLIVDEQFESIATALATLFEAETDRRNSDLLIALESYRA
jgi:hypothetical protein